MQLLDGDRAVEHGLEHLALAVLDALGDLDLALAGEQRDRAHLAQVHADGVARCASTRTPRPRRPRSSSLLLLDRRGPSAAGRRCRGGASPAPSTTSMPCSPSARQPAVDLIGRDHVLGHVVVDLVVGDEALLLAELDQLVAHRVAVARRHRARPPLPPCAVSASSAAASASLAALRRLAAAAEVVVLVVVDERRRSAPRRRHRRDRSRRAAPLPPAAFAPGLPALPAFGIGTKSSSSSSPSKSSSSSPAGAAA